MIPREALALSPGRTPSFAGAFLVIWSGALPLFHEQMRDVVTHSRVDWVIRCRQAIQAGTSLKIAAGPLQLISYGALAVIIRRVTLTFEHRNSQMHYKRRS